MTRKKVNFEAFSDISEFYLKRIKQKENWLFLQWLPNIFHLMYWKHKSFVFCCAPVKTLTFSIHLMKYIYYSPQKKVSKLYIFMLFQEYCPLIGSREKHVAVLLLNVHRQRSVNRTTLFLRRLRPTKQLTSTLGMDFFWLIISIITPYFCLKHRLKRRF